METGPLDPATHRGTWPVVVVLGVVDRVRRGGVLPWQPPLGVPHVGNRRLHEDDAGVRLPRTAQVRFHAACLGEIVVGRHRARLEAEAPIAVGLVSPLRSEGVLLSLNRQAREDVAVLKHGRRVAENEVHRARDFALAVELPPELGVERVLVAAEGAAEHHGLIRIGQERHRLPQLLPRAGRVLDAEITGYEAPAENSCVHK